MQTLRSLAPGSESFEKVRHERLGETLCDLGNGARYQKKLLGAVYAVGIALVLLMFFLIFQNDLFASK